MQKRWKVALVGLGLAGTLATAGGLVLAQSSNQSTTGSGLSWLVNDLATKLGVSPTVLKQDISDVVTTHLNQAVANGQMPAARAKAIEQAVANGKMPFGMMGRHSHGRRGGMVASAAVAKAIGITPQQLMTELKSGKTLLQVATAHGVSQTQLEAALTSDLKTRLDKAVAAGKLTQANENTILQKFQSNLGNLVNGKLGAGFKGGFGPRMGGFGGPMALGTVAKSFGLTQQQLMTELKSGKTLLQVATAHGVSQSQLESTLTSDMKARLDKAVAAGKMTQDQENTMLQKFQSNIGTLLNRQLGQRPPMGPGSWGPPNASSGGQAS